MTQRRGHRRLIGMSPVGHKPASWWRIVKKEEWKAEERIRSVQQMKAAS